MSPYAAQSQSLFGNVGGPNPPRYAIDGPGVVDAIANGTGSLIHQAYLRKQNEREQQIQSQRVQVESQREAREAANADREHEFKVTQERHRFMEAGGVPEHDIPGTPGQTVQLPTIAPQAPIRAAMGAAPNGLQQTPSADEAPEAASMPFTQPSAPPTHVPETVDPTRGIIYQRMMDQQRARGDVQNELADKKNANTLASRQIMADAAKAVAGTRADATKQAASTRAGATVKAAGIRAAMGGGTGPGGKKMTGNQQESYFEKVVAPGMLTAHGDNVQEAIDALNTTDEGKALKDAGFTSNHLLSEYEKRTGAKEKNATKLQSGPLGMGAKESVDSVNATRNSIRSSASGPATAPNTVDESKLSDADLWEAKVKAGMKKADATAYVKNRKKPTAK